MHLIAVALALLALLLLPAEPAHAVFLCNKAWVEIDSTGTTDPITLGAAVSGNQTLANCGITDGQSVRYSIFDGANFEVGTGTYTASGTTLTRNVIESTNSDTEIDLTATATLIIAPLTLDLPSESTSTEASPTASDYVFILQSGAFERSQISALESALEGFLDAADLQGDIALGTDTSGNYVDDVTAGTGISVTHTPGEGSDAAVAFSFSDQGASPALSVDQCVFTSNATASGYIVCEGDTADTIETRIAITDPATSDRTFTIPNADSIALADGDKGDITVSSTGTAWDLDEADVETELESVLDAADLQGDITLTTDTAGDYVATAADGTGIDGTATGEGSTYTPTFDATEITPTVTWGAGSFTTMTFDAGATDPHFAFGSGTIRNEGITSFRQADAANAGGEVRILEDPGTGSNYKSFAAPAAITTDTTCTLENDADFIPDSCVGDGTDDDVPDAADYTNLTGGTGITNSPTGTINFDATEVTPTVTWGAGSFTTMTFDAGAVDPNLVFGSGTIRMEGITSVRQADASNAGGEMRLLEDPGTGSNYKSFLSPASISADTQCTLEDDANFIPDSCVGDGSDDDVPEVGDFTNLVGGSGIDNNSGTLDFDATEISSATWGAGSFTSFTFDAGAVDPVLTFGSGTLLEEAVVSIRQADAANAGGFLKWLEDPGTGSNFIGIQAPSSITSDVTCTLENDSNPIPDSCVGDGSDGGGGLSGLTDNRILRADGTTSAQNSDASIGDTGFMQLWGLDTDFWLWHAGTDTEDIEIAGIKTRHATDPFGNGVLSGGDDILTITAKGNDGDSTENFAWIYFQAASGGESIGNGDTPGEIILGTTPDGSASVSERFRIASFGGLGVGGANYGTDNQALVSTGSTTAPAWESITGKKNIWLPASSLVPRTTNGCSIADLELATNDIMLRTCNYDASTEEGAGFTIKMPNTWDEGTLTAVFVWTHPATATNFGVVWGLSCLATSNDDAMDATLGTQQTATDTGGTTSDQYTSPATSAITCAGTPQADDTVYFEVERVAGNGSDSMTVDAYLMGVTIYYTENAFVEP